MYENIGGTVKRLAIGAFVVEVIGCLIAGIVMLADKMTVWGLVTIFGGIAAAVVIMCFIYAFGQLVEDTQFTRETLQLWYKKYPFSKTTSEKTTEGFSHTTNKNPVAPSVGTNIHKAAPTSNYIPSWMNIKTEQQASKQEGKKPLEKPDFAE